MTTTITANGVTTTEIDGANDELLSGVSWPAIFAGAAAAAALSLILLVLGAGLGFAAVSPWSASRETASTVGAAALGWLAFTQLVASSVGGYLAGRLRVRWASVHIDEVWFRDTAHGLLAWAVATLIAAAVLGSSVTGLIGGAVQAGGDVAKGVGMTAAVAGGSAAGASGGLSAGTTRETGATPYFVDTLFRSDAAHPADANDANDAQGRAEALRIFANGMRTGSMGPDDVRYLGGMVARRTGIPPADAEKRVADSFNQASKAWTDLQNNAKQAADTARKAAATAALWMFIALLAGALFASTAALVGGHQRDDRI